MDIEIDRWIERRREGERERERESIYIYIYVNKCTYLLKHFTFFTKICDDFEVEYAKPCFLFVIFHVRENSYNFPLLYKHKDCPLVTGTSNLNLSTKMEFDSATHKR